MTEYRDGFNSYTSTGDKAYTLKFVLVGSAGVGKTQLAARIVRGEFRDVSLPTVGMEFATRQLKYAEHSSVRAQIWDTAGKFPFKSITEAYFRGAVGAMVVYDISRRSTFDDLVQWLALVRATCHESISLILVGNKSDMSSKQREVSMMEGMRFARKYGLDFLETSALHDRHVEVACRQMIMSVARYLPQEKPLWTANKPTYPLPPGWVRITADLYTNPGREDKRKSERFSNNTPPLMPPPPPKPNQRSLSTSSAPRCGSYGCHTRIEPIRPSSSNNNKAPPTALLFENTWTGELVATRPLYPAGPSDVCVVSQVPRPLDPLTFLADPVKEDLRTGDGGNDRRGRAGLLKMVGGMTTSWSFSSLKRSESAGYASAAAHCLSRCVDS